MRSETSLNWVSVEWASTVTEPTPKAPTFSKISSFCVDSVDVESHLVLTQLMGNETLHQLSHCRMVKNLNKSANSRTKSKTHKSLIIWPIYVWSVWVRPPVNWVNEEWDFPPNESARSEPPRQLSQCRRHQHLQRFHHSALTQLTWSLT